MLVDRNFWNGKTVLITGHSGFKGCWLSLALQELGASVIGVSLDPETPRQPFVAMGPWAGVETLWGDVAEATIARELELRSEIQVIMHLAAQPLVAAGFADPIETFRTNVVGTARVLELARKLHSVEAVLVVTTDKVYDDDAGSAQPFAETAPLGGTDPYSASKVGSEFVATTYARSFLEEQGVPVGTARAGNVIGGGDFAAHRLLPDLWRACEQRRSVGLRQPEGVRPWQFVLEPLLGYLAYVEALSGDRGAESVPRALNFGPSADDEWTNRRVAQRAGDLLGWPECWHVAEAEVMFREADKLTIDPTLAGRILDWQTKLDVEESLAWSCDWYREFSRSGSEMREFSARQVRDYLGLVGVPASTDA